MKENSKETTVENHLRVRVARTRVVIEMERGDVMI